MFTKRASHIVATLLLIASASAVSKEPDPEVSSASGIRVEDELLGASFYLDDRELARIDLKRILASEDACEGHLKKTALYERVSGISGALGGGVLVYGVGLSVLDREVKTIPVSLGVASLALNLLCFKYLDGKNFKVAVDVFNRRRVGAIMDDNTRYGFSFSRNLP